MTAFYKMWIFILLLFLLQFFSALVFGLIKNQYLLNSDKCCFYTENEICEKKIQENLEIFYSPFFGLQSLYIIATIFFYLTLFLRCATLPEKISFLQESYTTKGIGLITFLSAFLFGLIANLFFTSGFDFPLTCTPASKNVMESITINSLFIKILAIALYYCFIISESDLIQTTYRTVVEHPEEQVVSEV